MAEMALAEMTRLKDAKQLRIGLTSDLDDEIARRH
jgi:phosphatidate phosphatase APP1